MQLKSTRAYRAVQDGSPNARLWFTMVDGTGWISATSSTKSSLYNQDVDDGIAIVPIERDINTRLLECSQGVLAPFCKAYGDDRQKGWRATLLTHQVRQTPLTALFLQVHLDRQQRRRIEDVPHENVHQFHLIVPFHSHWSTGSSATISWGVHRIPWTRTSRRSAFGASGESEMREPSALMSERGLHHTWQTHSFTERPLTFPSLSSTRRV